MSDDTPVKRDSDPECEVIVLDLRGLTSWKDVVYTVWNKLLGPSYERLNEPSKTSGDALVEVVADFLVARWGRPTKIQVVGLNDLKHIPKHIPSHNDDGYNVWVMDILNNAQYLALVMMIWKLYETQKDPQIKQLAKQAYTTRISTEQTIA